MTGRDAKILLADGPIEPFLGHAFDTENPLVNDHCGGCGKEIDPDTCGCGDPPHEYDGHPFVPMGCACMRADDGRVVAQEDPAEILLDAAEAYRLVVGFFGGDTARARLWMTTPNPMLGAFVPIYMALGGRANRLLRMVREALAENEPPTRGIT